jgi:hypothetical protein
LWCRLLQVDRSQPRFRGTGCLASPTPNLAHPRRGPAHRGENIAKAAGVNAELKDFAPQMNDQTVRDGRGNPIAFERVGAAFSHARSQLLHLCAFDGEEILEVRVLGTGLSL